MGKPTKSARDQIIYILSEHFIRYLLYLFFRSIGFPLSYPLRGLMHCVFRDPLLQTTVVMRGYLCYCPPSCQLRPAGPSPLTSLINNSFLPGEMLLTACFFTLETVRENPRRSAVSEILNLPFLAPTIFPRSKSHRSHFYPILTIGPEKLLNLLTYVCIPVMHLVAATWLAD